METTIQPPHRYQPRHDAIASVGRPSQPVTVPRRHRAHIRQTHRSAAEPHHYSTGRAGSLSPTMRQPEQQSSPAITIRRQPPRLSPHQQLRTKRRAQPVPAVPRRHRASRADDTAKRRCGHRSASQRAGDAAGDTGDAQSARPAQRRRANRAPIIPSRAAGQHTRALGAIIGRRRNRKVRQGQKPERPAVTRGVFAFATPPPLATSARGHHACGNLNRCKQRVGGVSPRAAVPVFESSLRPAANSHGVILGVDPSLRGTGYGVIRLAKPHPLALAHGTISCPAGWERSRCLAKISQTLRDVLKQHQPTVCVVEGLFYAQNLQTAIIMGEARGAALATIAEAGWKFTKSPRAR